MNNNEFEYIKNSFTKIGDHVNLEIDNLNVSCITSKNSNFNLDQEGNLTVRSVSANEGLLSYQAILDFIYPIGSIYLTVNNTNPNILLGGSWETWGSGRVPVGIDPSQEEFNVLEKAGGNKTVSLSVAELPKHTHIFTGNQLGNHSHGASGNISGGDHKHGFQNVECSKSMSSGTWSVLRPYRASGNGIVNAGEDLTSNHSHALSISVNQASAGTPTGTNAEVGSSTAHNNLQPYITCYMWKRTA